MKPTTPSRATAPRQQQQQASPSAASSMLPDSPQGDSSFADDEVYYDEEDNFLSDVVESTDNGNNGGGGNGRPRYTDQTTSNNNHTSMTAATAPNMVPRTPEWNRSEIPRQYDLAPIERPPGHGGGASGAPSYTIDPWENTHDRELMLSEKGSGSVIDDAPSIEPVDSGVYSFGVAPSEAENTEAAESTFIHPEQIHPNMENKEEEIAQLRLLAGKLSADWRSSDFMAPALARRIRDFQFAQEKRRKKYGDERPWGILGLYDHLSSIRIDVEWAEDAAMRRANGEPYLSWADFDESKRGGRNRPFFTYILLFICTVIMIASIAVNGWKVEPLSVNPMIGPSAETLIKMGAKDTYLIVNENEGWRLLTSSVLHAGLVHYGINMLALWFVGAGIETSHGWLAALIIFSISAVGGTILSAIFLPEYITVGASGGIFGLIGACLADIIMNWKLLFCDFVTENGKKNRHAMVVVFLLLDIVLNSIIGLTPFVDNFTHLGGMMYGFLCGLSTMERLSSDFFGMEEGWCSQLKHFLARFFGFIFSFICIVVTLILLLRSDGETTPCPHCAWLSCVPFPPWEGEYEKWWYCDSCNRVTAEIYTQPDYRLVVDCPDGGTAEVDLSDASESEVDREALEKQLPTYCRQYCVNSTDTEESRFLLN